MEACDEKPTRWTIPRELGCTASVGGFRGPLEQLLSGCADRVVLFVKVIIAIVVDDGSRVAIVHTSLPADPQVAEGVTVGLSMAHRNLHACLVIDGGLHGAEGGSRDFFHGFCLLETIRQFDLSGLLGVFLPD